MIKSYYQEADHIRYSNCHEDPLMLLANINNNYQKALSIASGGDNSFSLLTKNFSEVYVFDRNKTQLLLMKLKATAIKYLNYQEYLIFIGLEPGNSLLLYQQISEFLDDEVKQYFDNHLYLIKDIKIMHAGKFEYYFSLLKKVLKFTHSPKTIQEFMNCSSIAQQKLFYQKKFNNWRWKIVLKFFFSKKIMKKYGRDQAFFHYVRKSIPKHLQKRLMTGFSNVLNKENPYLQYAVYNTFITKPHYLILENYYLIKENIDKLKYIHGDLRSVGEQKIKFDFFNLSDIFEYMSIDETELSEELIFDMAYDKARIVFWNMIVPRSFKKCYFQDISSQELFFQDKAFYYMDLKIYEVKK